MSIPLDPVESLLEDYVRHTKTGRQDSWRARLEFWDDLTAYCAANAYAIREDNGDLPEDGWDGMEDDF